MGRIDACRLLKTPVSLIVDVCYLCPFQINIELNKYLCMCLVDYVFG